MLVESEKRLEVKLRDGVKAVGGWCIKFPAVQNAGIPDRVCLFPGGVCAFVEMKSTGKKPTKLQLIVHRKLNALGFPVTVLDTSEKIKNFIEKHVKRN